MTTTPLLRTAYTAVATATGGRDGHARTDDGVLDVDVRVPRELGGPGGGTNPEQLFAAGYGACFLSALANVARKERVDVSGGSITAHVSIGPIEEGRFGLAVELVIDVPAVPRPTLETLVEAAHEVCPYSNATRGNIDVRLTLA